MSENIVASVVEQADRLLAALSSLCTSDNTDVTIECGDQTFGCHAVILKARSMFFYNLVENGCNVIKVDGVKQEVMKDVISYIYTSQVLIETS